MNAALERILRTPLLHFALAGVLLFVLAAVFDVGGLGERARGLFGSESGSSAGDLAGESPDPSNAVPVGCVGTDPAAICVSRDALLGFIQSQTGLARVGQAAQAFDAGTEAVRRDWVDRFVREEALVREARALGLDRSDELIRRRLVQQMEFLVEGVGTEALEVTDAEIEAAYRAQAHVYRHPATFRFAHVFVGARKGGESKASVRAKSILDEMNRKKISFEEGYPYGDRFLYDRTYVDRTADEIRAHFGDAFAKAIEIQAPTPGRWTGPYRSEHGLHLLMLVDERPARDASLEEVRGELREALLREKQDRAVELGVAAIVAKYRVEVARGIESPTPAGATP